MKIVDSRKKKSIAAEICERNGLDKETIGKHFSKSK